ncbi:hypothetical protein K525DRAFT_268674 [Schizophyllum commune Loenen D]|nr:hypothetical protein K525DRAFT_268674 [Schizophyllum commune Loenen D]
MSYPRLKATPAVERSDLPTPDKSTDAYYKDSILDDKRTTLGEPKPRGKIAKARRSKGEILNDLRKHVLEHNGDTYTVCAWLALDLAKHPSRATSHFLAITLRRNLESTNPRAMYTLIDADMLPFSVLQETFEGRWAMDGSYPVSPMLVLEHDARGRKVNDGALGSVMVFSVELQEDEEKTVEEAVRTTMVPIMSPLGLFEVHQRKFASFPMNQLNGQKSLWMRCLENGLKGGAFSLNYTPYYG